MAKQFLSFQAQIRYLQTKNLVINDPVGHQLVGRGIAQIKPPGSPGGAVLRFVPHLEKA